MNNCVRHAAIASVLIFGIQSGSAILRAQEASPSLVKKTMENFSGGLWKPAQWNKATGTITAESGGAPNVPTGKSQKFVVQFSGTGFENFSAEAPTANYIPGDAQRLTFRVKRSDKRFPVSLGFIDGWGRGEVNGKYFSIDPRLEETTDWQTISVEIPKDWVRPVRLNGITTHNFSATGEKVAVTFQYDDIEVETDIRDVDPETGVLKSWKPDPKPADKSKALAQAPATPLVTVAVSTPEVGNVFSNTEPKVTVQVQNWKPGTLTGTASFAVVDDQGTKGKEWQEKLSIESSAVFDFPIETKRFGLYTVSTFVALSDGKTTNKKLVLARIPAQKELTAEQKIASRYGINYHGGAERLFRPFKKSGLYWFRDYGFGLDWMLRAKGADRRYAGWPFYPSIVRDYEAEGLMMMPVLHGIVPPEMKDGKVTKMGPSDQWVRDIADILIAFPSIHYWELDNEYDLGLEHNLTVEKATNWENYKLYHQKFGELVSLLGGGKWTAVENGRAGIYPKATAEMVRSGSFAKIDVLNVHHYCGTNAPELNAANFNRGLEPGQVQGFFYDSLRGLVRAKSLDGKKREAWLTEIGWDTVSGPAVPVEKQAAYLQRVFLLSFAAGIEKVFWFYNFDAAKMNQIFDSCGLFTFDVQPKLSYPAMAGLTTILPRPKYVGTINAGPNTGGYVFENDGELVAGLWVLDGDEGPKVSIKAKQLYDYFGNKLSGTTAALRLAPTYAVGLDKSDPLYKQTAYEIESPYLMVATAGDPAEIVVSVRNNRGQDISGQAKLTLPAGWNASKLETPVAVKAGERQEVKIPFVVNGGEKLGVKEVSLAFNEGGQLIKAVPLRVVVQQPFLIEPAPLEGSPGKAKFNVTITNQTASVQNGTLKLQLPSGWQATTAEVAVNALKPGEARSVPVELVWKPEWKEGETAQVAFDTTPSRGAATAPIIPNAYRLQKAEGITFDGNVADWKAAYQLPGWMLGSTVGNTNAKVWLAWTPEGLCGAVEVEDSKGYGEDPKTFWIGDVLELFVSTQPDKRQETFQKGDHQFWILPQFDQKRVYVGRWKVKDEIAEAKYDVAGTKGMAVRTDKGYRMEFMIPASAFDSAAFQSGGTIALNMNLTVRGIAVDREIYWPRKKASGVNTTPSAWGFMKLGN